MNNLDDTNQSHSGVEDFCYYDLTNPQLGIWYTEQFYPESGINNIAGTLYYDGPLDFQILNDAFNEFIRIHDGIRLRLYSEDGEVKQYISEYSPVQLELFDFSGRDKSDFTQWEKETTQSPIFGEDKDLFYFCMLKLPDNKAGFFIKFHHIISDAWSTVMVGDQVVHIYKKLSEDTSYSHENMPSYTDFIKKDTGYADSEKYVKDREFWLNEFHDIPDTASIKTRKKKNTSITASRKSFYLPEKLVAKLRSYSLQNGKSVFALFLSALAIYMNRVTEKEDLVIGIPSLNRSGIKEKSMFGLFVTTIPIVLSIPEEDTYMNFSDQVMRKWRSILRHHKYPVSQIMKDIRECHPGTEKIYDVVLSYQNAKFTKHDIDKSFHSAWHFSGEQNESLCIHINDREDDDQILIDYDYLTDIFYGKDIEALHDHMIRILWHGLDAARDRKVRDLEMVSEKEKSLILNSFNDTRADFPDDITIIDVFKEKVKIMPDDPAVYFNDIRMTYKELDNQSERLARILHSKGVSKDVVVGIMVKRSFAMMISILAIWKAGGAYMPIDPDFPTDRIEYMLENSKANTVLSLKQFMNNELENPEVEFIDVNEILESDYDPTHSEPLAQADPGDLAYVIYTSGSTGKPKGVMNEHRALMNRINWMHKKYPIDNEDVILQKTTYSFDVSVWELTWWFFAGAKMVFLAPGEEKNPGAIIAAIEQYAVTTMHFVPSMLGAFLTYLEASDPETCQRIRTLNRVFASGEALTLKQTERFNKLLNKTNSTTLHNLYGPTEAAIDVTYYDCPEAEELNSVPIGKPIDNIKLYIVNKYDKLQPVNVAGELCIGGVGVARGYLNKEKLTNEKFVDNPFEPGTKMYRTGDLARWYPRGDIEYLGRIDSQIKIRGYRVELGEIQTQIISFGQVDNAIVTSVTDINGNITICAYLVPKQGTEISTEQLNTYLKTKLPEYMVPQSFVIIEELPLLANGKVNYKQLPKPDISVSVSENAVSPRNEIESEIYSIWCSVLSKNNFGITDDFFTPELGGDSLRAIEVVCGMPKKDGVMIDITDFYQNPTIEALAEFYSDEKIEENSLNKLRSKYLLELSSNESSGKIPEKGISYICCPYGGGSAYVYVQLANALFALHSSKQESFNFYSVNLPGHNYNNGSQDFVDIETVADGIMNELRYNEKIANSRIVIYAHCVGNALGMKLLRRLENENFDVACMFAGAIFPSKWIQFFPESYDPWKRLKDDTVLSYLLKAGFPAGDLSEGTKAELMAAFRFDVKEYYKYLKKLERENRIPLTSPIISVVGDQDSMARGYKKKYKNYSKYTYGKTSMMVIENAQHYFVKTHASVLAKMMRDKLEEDGLIQEGFRKKGIMNEVI